MHSLRDEGRRWRGRQGALRAIKRCALLACLWAAGCYAAPVAVAPAPDKGPAAQVEQISPPLAIGPGGAMQLNTPAAFSIDALAEKFPGLDLIEGRVVQDRQPQPVIQARADGMTLFEIFPAPGGRSVGVVVTRSPAVAGPQAEVIGSTRLRDLPPEETALCASEVVAGERRQMCRPQPDSPFVRVFRPQIGIDLPRDGVARLETLAGGDVLMEMRWSPPKTS